MKIRADFVTNSSSSSFTCCALYSEELYNFLQNLIAEHKYKEQPSWVSNKTWITPEHELYVGFIWEELKFDKSYFKVQTTQEYGDTDKDSVYKYIKSFFTELNKEENDRLKELIFEVYKNKDYKTKKYKDFTDGFSGYDFYGGIHKANPNLFEYSDVESVEIDNKVFILTGIGDEEYKVVPIIVNNGGIIKNSVVLSTDYLLVGADYQTVKYKRAIELNTTRGKDIKILDYKRFLELTEKYKSKQIKQKEKTPSPELQVENNLLKKCNNKKAESIDILDSITEIGCGAFEKCRKLKRISLPQSLVKIGYNAFRECESLEEISFPGSLETIGEEAFSNCTSLKGIIVLPDGMKKVGQRVFRNCNNIESVLLPEGITKIEKGLFYGCSKLSDIIIPNGVKSIEDSAFYGCTGLRRIVIKNEKTTLGKWVFMNCDKLTIVAPPGSCAEKYAKENVIPFEPVEK